MAQDKNEATSGEDRKETNTTPAGVCLEAELHTGSALQCLMRVLIFPKTNYFEASDKQACMISVVLLPFFS